ncbi:MAG: hypothetical protein K8R77_08495 [Anaerolineaceae bacterium]|nr:hypothetical protein [Anaerolineaceae bacterium]
MKSILTRMYATVIELVVGLLFGYLITQKASMLMYMFTRSIRRGAGF